MTDKKTEALKLALEALKQIDEAMPFPVAKFAQAAIREALAEQPAQRCKYGNEPTSCTSSPMDCQCALDAVFEQPAQQQEPIYQMQMMDGKWIDQAKHSYEYNKKHGNTVRVLYTSPPASKPLTDEEIKAMYIENNWYEMAHAFTWGAAEVVVRAIEAKLREKNA